MMTIMTECVGFVGFVANVVQVLGLLVRTAAKMWHGQCKDMCLMELAFNEKCQAYFSYNFALEPNHTMLIELGFFLHPKIWSMNLFVLYKTRGMGGARSSPRDWIKIGQNHNHLM